jgi:hypothetical protein
MIHVQPVCVEAEQTDHELYVSRSKAPPVHFEVTLSVKKASFEAPVGAGIYFRARTNGESVVEVHVLYGRYGDFNEKFAALVKNSLSITNLDHPGVPVEFFGYIAQQGKGDQLGHIVSAVREIPTGFALSDFQPAPKIDWQALLAKPCLPGKVEESSPATKASLN